MASNLAGNVCIGQLNACIVRAARLDADCTPTGGADTGIVTAGLATLTADPQLEEGTMFEPKNACGDIMYTYEQDTRIKRYSLSGEFLFFDYEMMALLFGGGTILGRAAGSFSGKVIGHYMPKYTAAASNGVYLEVITQNVTAGSGTCIPATVGAPAYTGHIFGKAKLYPGSRTFENDVARCTFTGTATNNGYLTDGPFNDFPGTGYTPDSPYIQVGYSAAEYATIAAGVSCGYKITSPGS